MTCLKRTHSSKIRNIVGVSALALLAAGCAANASGNNFKDKSGNFYTDNDFRGGFPNYGNNTASRTLGIDDARRAHRLYADAQAEEFDGYCEQVVTIERGETLSDIAEYCDVSVADLIEANTQIRNVHNIEIGQQVRIPDNTGSVYEGQIFSRATYRADDEDDFVNVNYVPRAGNQPFYVVRPGDTLSEISAETNVTYRTLASLNPGLRPRQLEVGQRIYLPASVGQTRRPVYYDEDPGVRPVVSISPARGPKNGKIQILAEGFERGTEVNVFIGRGQDDLTRLKIVETDGDGRINETVYLPDHYAHNEAVVALKPANYDGYVTSELYVVESVSQRNASTHSDTRAVHTVEDGQTLAWIASRYEVPMSALVDANPNIRWSALSGGERIILPEGSVTATGRADATPVMASVPIIIAQNV